MQAALMALETSDFTDLASKQWVKQFK